MYLTENLQEKWQVGSPRTSRFAKNRRSYKRAVTTVILEKTKEKAVREDKAFLSEASNWTQWANATGSSVDNFDPVLISLVRRAMINLIAYDICGVQLMTGTTGVNLCYEIKIWFTSWCRSTIQ